MGLLAYDVKSQFFGKVRGLHSICRNSCLDIGKGSKGRNTKFKLKNGSLKIGNNCDLGSLRIQATNCNIYIGNNVRFVGHSDISSFECNVYIGNNCLFANGCWITTSDHHPIHDLSTDEILNLPKPILIENDVWLAREVIVLKGAIIRQGSAIGIRSVVTKEIPANCVAAGIPAKPVKLNTKWKP